MQSSASIALVRDNLSDSVVLKLRHMIVDGQLPAGARINEVHLSRQLAISRTPLREALARLAQEGALRSVARIGYFVRPLTVEEFEQLYDIRPILDPEALRLAGLPSRERMEQLQDLNDAIGRARDSDTIINLDDEFHMELIAACPNQVLIELIRQIIQRTRRYEIGADAREPQRRRRDGESQGDHDGAAQARSARGLRRAPQQSAHRPRADPRLAQGPPVHMRSSTLLTVGLLALSSTAALAQENELLGLWASETTFAPALRAS